MADGAAPNALSLPGDVIFDILSWTPVKSVCRFRCVSKGWEALISDPAFVVKHRSRAAPEPFLVDVSGEEHPADRGILVMDIKGKFVKEIKGLGGILQILSSFDHLVCVSCIDRNIRVVDVTNGNVLLTFQKSKEANAIRLGRAAVSGAYKVVCLATRLHGEVLHQACIVLTLGDGTGWRRAQSPPEQASIHGDDCCSATVNGIVYFLTSTPYDTPAPHKPQDRVLCFDLESEEWNKTIQGPLKGDSELLSKTENIRITQLKNALCMIQPEVFQTDHLRTNLWLLVDPDNSIWVKKYVIPMAMSLDVFEPLWVMPDGVKLLLYYSCFATSHVVELLVFDDCSGKSTVVMDISEWASGIASRCSLHLDRFVAQRDQPSSRHG